MAARRIFFQSIVRFFFQAVEPDPPATLSALFVQLLNCSTNCNHPAALELTAALSRLCGIAAEPDRRGPLATAAAAPSASQPMSRDAWMNGGAAKLLQKVVEENKQLYMLARMPTVEDELDEI